MLKLYCLFLKVELKAYSPYTNVRLITETCTYQNQVRRYQLATSTEMAFEPVKLLFDVIASRLLYLQ